VLASRAEGTNGLHQSGPNRHFRKLVIAAVPALHPLRRHDIARYVAVVTGGGVQTPSNDAERNAASAWNQHCPDVERRDGTSPPLSRKLLRVLERVPGLGRLFVAPVVPAPEAAGLTGHVVICGFGRVGRELAAALEDSRHPYLVIEYNPFLVEELRERQVPVIYGDAANPAVLEHAHLDAARLMAVLIPDASTAELATRHARAAHPDLDIIARAGNVQQIEALRRAGASEVVQPEFEAGVEVLHHVLRRYGEHEPALGAQIAARRTAFYHLALADEA